MYFCPYKPIRPVNMKKRFLYSLLVAGMFSLQACQTVEQFSVDYMMPADISFPAELKRVAIVNNMPNVPDNKLISSEETKPKSETEIASRTDYYNGDARIAAESLAESVASHNYFDLVVICDSALRSRDIHPRETTLAQEEVRQLTRELGVDFLISLENIQLKSTRKLEYIPSWRGYYGTVDVKVYPIVRIYLPNRSVPMATVSNTDSIFWEKSGLNEDILGQLVSEKELVEEASAFAGTVPVKHLLPYWTTGRRHLFTGGTVNMRDAAIYVKEKNWEEAIRLWKIEFDERKGKRKMYAACNIALGYEMQDLLDEAYQWAVEAQKTAYEIDGIEQKKKGHVLPADVPNYLMTSIYVSELKERKDGMTRLKVQMKRINGDF